MLLSPSSLKHHVAAAARGRYALNSLALTPLGVVSTDGHCLLLAPYPHADPADMPRIDGLNVASPVPATPFLVSVDDAARAAAIIGKPRRYATPGTQLVQAEARHDGIVFGATDLSNAQTMTARAVDGQWPDVGAVIPDFAGALAVTLNLANLLRALKALAGATTQEVVTLRIIDDQQAIGLSCRDGAAMLIMPMPVDAPTDHVPCQLSRLRPDGPAVPAPTVPAPTPAPPAEVADQQRPRRSRRRKAADPAAELQAILS